MEPQISSICLSFPQTAAIHKEKLVDSFLWSFVILQNFAAALSPISLFFNTQAKKAPRSIKIQHAPNEFYSLI